MTKQKKPWRIIGDYGVTSYQCGIKASDDLRLVKQLTIVDHEGAPTGEVHEAGEVWRVLTGSASDPDIVWLQEPCGDRHTWSDDDSLFEYFELVVPPENVIR